VYFLCAKHKTDFIADYTEAWRIQSGIDCEVVIFVDNGHRLVVPCSTTEDDRTLMTRLRTFHGLIQTESGIFELCGAKSTQRIDIVKVCVDQTHGQQD
jgi:hypothetical protein